jgi:multiple sugar transport system substrate-binding protein
MGRLGVFLRIVFCLLAVSAFGCRRSAEEGGARLVLKHGRIEGNPAAFHGLLRAFEAENPGIRVVAEALPSSTDEQHQFYIINLEGRSADFDVFSVDVIWAAEFARAGWLRDLTSLLPEEERSDFFPTTLEAVTFDDRVYALPWYADAGLLYYRRDLLERHGLRPPRTWPELVSAAQRVIAAEPGLYGYVWQGKQGESLVCNALEYLWSHGGSVFSDGALALDRPENAQALQFMRDLVAKHRVTPPTVSTADEETTRRLFGAGRAVFMRNWPYAFEILQREGSPVRGRVGVTALPAAPGRRSASTLGGWQLGVNRYSRQPEAAERLVRHLTGKEAQKELALSVGYRPTRRSLYEDPELREKQAFTETMRVVLEAARPRPVTPYYMMITQVLQPEFSAVLSGIRSPQASLRSAAKQAERILEVGR